jgi:hypothetical protein
MAHKISPKISVKNVSLPKVILPDTSIPQNNPFGQAGREFGRISGPLLSANLLRNSHDLSFETELLYLSVNSGFVGIKNSTPVRALDMGGAATTDNLIVDTETDIGIGFQITTNQIYNSLNLPILLQPNQSGTPIINVSGSLNTANLNFATNAITGTANTNISITPYQNPNYVANAGFETGDTTGWTVTGDTTKIVVVGVDNAISGSYALSAASYIQTSTVKQTLNTDPGQTYVITFSLKNIANIYLATEPGLSIMTTEDSLNVIALTPNATIGQADFKVLWNGDVLTGGSPTGPGPALPYGSPSSIFWDYTTYTFTTTAVGSDQLSFSFRNDFSIFYIDKISVILQGTTGGTTQINSNTLVNGILHATGDITFDGDIVFGDSVNDRISIPAEVSSDIIPLESTVTITPTTAGLTDQLGNALTSQAGVGLFTNPGAPYQQTNSWNLGSGALEWNNVWLNNATLYTDLTANSVTTSLLTAGNISISTNTISNATADLNLTTLGVGQVKINGATVFSQNTINNPSFSNPYFTTESGSFIITTETGALAIAAEVTALPFTIKNTGAGVTKFSGTKALRLPAGTTAVRPADPQTGTARYNTSNQNTEIYNGTSWQDIAGVSTTTSAENDLTTIWSLILG